MVFIFLAYFTLYNGLKNMERFMNLRVILAQAPC